MSKKSVARNYIYNTFYQVLTIVLPMISAPYLARVLGAGNIGIHGFTSSIVVYFVLIGGLGLNNYGRRQVAAFQDDRKARSRLFWELALFRGISMGITTIIYILIFCIVNIEYSRYFRLLIVEIIASTFDITWFYEGVEDFKKIVIRNSAVRLLGFAAIFIFVRSGDDLWKYFLVYSVFNFFSNFIMWSGLPRYIDKCRINIKSIKKHIRPTISLFIPQIASSIYTVLDKTMVGTLNSNIAEVGYYEQAQRIIKITMTLVSSVSVVMIPRVSKNSARGDQRAVSECMGKTFDFVWFLSLPLMFGLAAISWSFVSWFFGDGYDKVKILMSIGSSLIPVISLSVVTGSQLLMSIGKHHIHTKAVACGAVINIVLNVLLIPTMGALGATIATIAAEFFITFYDIRATIKSGILTSSDVFRSLPKYATFSSVMLVVCLCIPLFSPLDGAAITILQVFAGATTYIGLLVIFRDRFLIDGAKKILRR